MASPNFRANEHIANELAESANSGPVFDHCVRSYLFGRELAAAEGQVAGTLPRADLGYAITEEIVGQVLRNPQKYSPATFAGGLAQAHPGGQHLPSWFGALGVAPWGDHPVRDSKG